MAYRIGGTSCTYPGDLLQNVRTLAPLVEDVELVLFDDPEYGCNFPERRTAGELLRLKKEHDLTYTVHLPKDLRKGDDSMEQALRAIRATEELEPFAFVAHLDGRTMGEDWEENSLEVLEILIREVPPGKLCLENLETWEAEALDPLVDRLALGRCVDVGHLWHQNRNPMPYLERHLPRTRVVHLHRAHEGLRPDIGLSRVLEALSTFQGVVTLEVFDPLHLSESRKLLEKIR